jgi:hypothetical protein
MFFAKSRFRFLSAFLLTLSVSLFLSSCKESPKWSTDSKSPDGKLIATARSYDGGGFGASGPSVTNVYLNWAAGSQKPVQVLGLHDESDKPVETRVEMRWLNPTHLEIIYNAKVQAIDFQAVKFVGVDITLRDLAAQTSSNTISATVSRAASEAIVAR